MTCKWVQDSITMKEIVQPHNINMKKQILKSMIHKEAMMRKLY